MKGLSFDARANKNASRSFDALFCPLVDPRQLLVVTRGGGVVLSGLILQ